MDHEQVAAAGEELAQLSSPLRVAKAWSAAEPGCFGHGGLEIAADFDKALLGSRTRALEVTLLICASFPRAGAGWLFGTGGR
jgi:hypothetical protein